MNLLVIAGSLGTGSVRAEPAAQFRDCAECPEMVRLPAGTFVMGTPSPEGRPTDVKAESQSLIVRIPKSFALGR
jgi:formylglycine-generating enzyme required for sulfatase activity